MVKETRKGPNHIREKRESKCMQHPLRYRQEQSANEALCFVLFLLLSFCFSVNLSLIWSRTGCLLFRDFTWQVQDACRLLGLLSSNLPTLTAVYDASPRSPGSHSPKEGLNETRIFVEGTLARLGIRRHSVTGMRL